MSREKSLVQSMWEMRCPRCRKGKLFSTPTFSFSKPFFMPNHCDKCGQKYFLEPGFYYGAMFISYIISGFFCLIVVGVLMLGLDLDVWTSFAILLAILAVLFIWFFRISRSIFIHMRVMYSKKIAQEVSE